MMWRDVIDILVIEEGTNENGFPEKVITERKTIFANKKSVRNNEFYQAAQSGFSLGLMFEVRSIDYDRQEVLEHELKQYEIIRTYDKGETTELICQAYPSDQL